MAWKRDASSRPRSIADAAGATTDAVGATANAANATADAAAPRAADAATVGPAGQGGLVRDHGLLHTRLAVADTAGWRREFARASDDTAGAVADHRPINRSMGSVSSFPEQMRLVQRGLHVFLHVLA